MNDKRKRGAFIFKRGERPLDAKVVAWIGFHWEIQRWRKFSLCVFTLVSFLQRLWFSSLSYQLCLILLSRCGSQSASTFYIQFCWTLYVLVLGIVSECLSSILSTRKKKDILTGLKSSARNAHCINGKAVPVSDCVLLVLIVNSCGLCVVCFYYCSKTGNSSS